MAVEIEREPEWALGPLAFALLSAACFIAVVLRRPSPAAGELGHTSPASLRFHRSFLILFSLSSVMEGIQAIFGEYEFEQCRLSREQMASRLSFGAAAALSLGTLSGIFSDIGGPQKTYTLFCILHLLVGVLKILSPSPCVWISTIFLPIATSIFSFSFEAWMVMEHEKQGQKHELLYEVFWLMTYFESASLVGSQGLANILISFKHMGNMFLNSLVILVAITCLLYSRKGFTFLQQSLTFGSYKKSFSAHVLRDKRVMVLLLAQASINFSVSVFWLLWAPTLVQDGRDVKLSQLYGCFIGSRMLGSAIFPWFAGTVSPHNEDLLTTSFITAGVALMIVAYDYQEIGMLVTLFCIFHVAVGFILPSLARLRTLYLPNELRGGMMSLSLVPANAAILIILIAGGYRGNIADSTIMAFGACSLFIAGGSMHMLRRWGKHPRFNQHSL